jgi:hypothetical protein
MTTKELTALVIVRAASGKRMAPEAQITSQNVREYLPSPDTLQTALETVRNAGFKTGTPVANIFSITADPRTFESFFHTKIDVKKTANLQLPIPPELAPVVETVTFEAPRELH